MTNQKEMFSMNKQLASSIALWSRLGVAFGALLSTIAVLVLGGSAMSAFSGSIYSAASAVRFSDRNESFFDLYGIGFAFLLSRWVRSGIRDF